MDISSLTALILEKFKDANGYSELDDVQLAKTIYKYLYTIYHKYFEIARKKIEDDERKGIFPDKAKYKKEYDLVEDIVMIYANKLAATEKGEV